MAKRSISIQQNLKGVLMISKLNLALVACVAVVSISAFSTNAWALTDPNCDGAPYGNYPLIHDLRVDTEDTYVAYEPSSVFIGGLVCGSYLGRFGGNRTLYEKIEIGIPPGVWIHTTDLFREPPYVGKVSFSGLVRFGGPRFIEDVRSELRAVDSGGETDCPVAAVACYSATNSFSHSWIWVVENNRAVPGEQVLTIGPIHLWNGRNLGVTRFELKLCRTFSFGPGNMCGLPHEVPVQKNGDPSNCDERDTGAGIYTAVATQRGGRVTASAKDCINWIY